MDRIQELIDERRAELPTGLAKELLELCQKESSQERLFNVTTVRIVAHSYTDCDCDSCCDLRPIKQRHILKVKSRSSHPTFISEQEWLDMGYMEESWIDAKMPRSCISPMDASRSCTTSSAAFPSARGQW